MEKQFPEFSAVLFDMDGVIFDTEKVVVACWQEVAKKYGIPHIEDTCRKCLGLNQEATVRIFLDTYGEDFPYAAYKQEMRELFFGPYYEQSLTVKKGGRELLAALKNAHIPVALATSTAQASVLKELKDAGIRDYFDQVICGDMVSHSKPHPEIFLTACAALGAKPEKTIVIEDSYNGIRAAHAGGMMPVMVPDMLQPTDEIKKMTIAVCESLLVVKEKTGL